MYPQTVVPLTNPIHDALTAGWNDNTKTDVTKVEGVYYTANKDGIRWNPNEQDPTYSQELNEVYSYKGDRYVKVTPYSRYVYDESHAEYKAYTYNNGEPLEQVTAAAGDAGRSLRWFKVEPIKWITLNINSSASTVDAQGIVTELRLFGSSSTTLELYSADVLMSGIRFGGNSIWSTSDINKYLNQVFYKEAFRYTSENTFNDSTIYNNNSDGTQHNVAAYGLNSNHFPTGGQNGTTQKIYLLSHYELLNINSSYGPNGSKVFADNGTMTAAQSRQVKGTDYARAHNLVLSSGSTQYLTRTAGSGTSVYRVDFTGEIGHVANNTATLALYGTRPALCKISLY